MRRILAMVLVCVFAMLRVDAADFAGAFEEGNRFYEQGNYAAAANVYDKLLQGGQASEALYFNRGDALFKQGQLGKAIASWRQAEQLAPRDPEVQANLQFARTQARGGVPFYADPWARYLGLLTVNEWTVATTAAGWAFFGLLAAGQWRPELGRKLRIWLAVAGVATVVFGSSLAEALSRNYLVATAIVTAGEADVRIGPLDESQSLYKVRDGIELEVLDRKDNWLQVMDSSQRAGWVRQDQVLIWDPARKGGS